MNQRIKELTIEAGYNTAREDEGFGYAYENFDHKKFAELLIKDCVRVVLDTYGTGACRMDPHIAVLEACRNIESEFDVDMGHLTDYVEGEDE